MMYELSIIQWAAEKDIFNKATPKDQLLKAVEELGEVASCLNKGDMNEIEIRTEIGDLLVTIIIFSRMCGYSVDECLKAAYEKISKRTGKMVDGVFVKDE